MCNTSQKNHDYAKGHPSSKKNKGEDNGLSVENVVLCLTVIVAVYSKRVYSV